MPPQSESTSYVTQHTSTKAKENTNHLHVNSQSILSCTTLTISSDIPTAVSLSSSIEWDDCEDILVTGTGVVRSEGVVCLSDISTVSTGDGCWVVCHIVDEDRVPDIRINTSHIQREGRAP